VEEQKIRVKMKLQEQEEQLIKKIVDEIVLSVSKELDEFVKTVDNYLRKIKEDMQKGNVVEYDDSILELQCIKLPVLMYFASDKLEDLALASDVAKADYQYTYDQIIQKVDGTIPEKESSARLHSVAEKYAEIIKERAYRKLKARLEYADKIFHGLRKVLSKRISDQEVFRMEIAKKIHEKAQLRFLSDDELGGD